ncbi:hypothetical protein Y032_0006g2811 [Ancylostoma ceylanicum]|uniref:Uncharacterized protein n=1 Tax=Ancylostoma ceylanicum TaxID=53326 RepID=A0A016VNJ1_9BILA|nr:hypothetical protein Y032_0006g2811 [Ancylostoma ceylanicum]
MNMTTILGDGIDLLILSIFFHFRSGTGKDVSTGDLQCAEHESDNRFGLNYRFIDFIDFFHLRSGTVNDSCFATRVFLIGLSIISFFYQRLSRILFTLTVISCQFHRDIKYQLLHIS